MTERVALIEPQAGGHRLWYVRLLVDAAEKRGLEVELWTTSGVPLSEDFKMHLQESRLTVHVANGHGGPWYDSVFDAIEASRVVVPEVDAALPAILRSRHVRNLKGAGLVLRPFRGPSVTGAARFYAKRALLSRVRRAAPSWDFLQLAMTAGPQSTVPSLGLPRLADPVEISSARQTRETAREVLGISHDVVLFLLAGAITPRKHAEEIVQGWAAADRRKSMLALVGKVDEEVMRTVSTLPAAQAGRLKLVNEYVSDRQMETWLTAADYVTALHRNEGSSGIVLKSWALGTPVIVGGAKTLISDVRRLGSRRIEVPIVTSSEVSRIIRQAPPTTLEPASVQDLAARLQSFGERLIRSDSPG